MFSSEPSGLVIIVAKSGPKQDIATKIIGVVPFYNYIFCGIHPIGVNVNLTKATLLNVLK